VPIEAGLVNKAIENAQTKVEGYNFDIRKHVLRYDEVVNEQRNRIYDQRRRILTEPSLRLTIEDMIAAEVLRHRGRVHRRRIRGRVAARRTHARRCARSPIPKVPDNCRPRTLAQQEARPRSKPTLFALAQQAYAAKEVEIGEPVMRNAEKQIMLWAVDSSLGASPDRPRPPA
jgi:preprotein translocase subunit SecA